MYLTGFGEFESDIVVVANVIQAFGLFCQFVVTLDIVLTFPSAVQCYFQHVVLVSLQFEFECVFLGLDGCGVPSVGFVETGIHNQCAVTRDVELRCARLRIITGATTGRRHVSFGVPCSFDFFALFSC